MAIIECSNLDLIVTCDAKLAGSRKLRSNGVSSRRQNGFLESLARGTSDELVNGPFRFQADCDPYPGAKGEVRQPAALHPISRRYSAWGVP
jgi:hypothetical protein